jgi:hypothetical protein
MAGSTESLHRGLDWMTNILKWIAWGGLAALTLFHAVLLYIAEIGFKFNQSGSTPGDLQYGWLVLLFKVLGLALASRTGFVLLLVGIIDWGAGIFFFGMHNQHLCFGKALLNDWFGFLFVLLALIYFAVRQWQLRQVQSYST